MTKEELINKLKEINQREELDTEKAHSDADDLLIEYINDEEVKYAYDKISKWYA